jgi:hypothetical protein
VYFSVHIIQPVKTNQYAAYPSPAYQFMGIQELTTFIRFLEANNLTFDIAAPDLRASAWEALNTSLIIHLTTQKMEIHLPEAPHITEGYDNLPWQLLQQSINRRDNKQTFKPIEVPCYNFVGQLLQDTGILHPYKIHTLLLAISQFQDCRVLQETNRINRSCIIKRAWANHNLGRRALCTFASCVHAMACSISGRPFMAPTEGQETPTDR